MTPLISTMQKALILLGLCVLPLSAGSRAENRSEGLIKPPQQAPLLEKTCAPRALGTPLTCRITLKAPKKEQATTKRHPPLRLIIKANAPASNITPPLKLLSLTSNQWNCDTSLAPTLICTLKATTLSARKDIPLTVSYHIQPTREPALHLCTALHQDKGGIADRKGQTKPQNKTPIQPLARLCRTDEINITLAKTGPTACHKGEDCTFNLTFKNHSNAPFERPITLADALGLSGREQTVPIIKITPPLPCSTPPTALPFLCKGVLNLAPNESRTHKLTIRFKKKSSIKTPHKLRNCSVMFDQKISSAKQAPPAKDNHPGTKPQKEADESGPASCHYFKLQESKPPATTPPRSTPCPKPQMRSKNGRCLCPKGTKKHKNSCKKVLPPACTPGKNGLRTPKGTCLCKKGYKGTPPNCRKPTCPKGFKGTPPNCRKPTCPKGFKGTPPNCRRLTCPKGTVGKYPKCRKPLPPCPKGTKRFGKKCIKPAT